MRLSLAHCFVVSSFLVAAACAAEEDNFEEEFLAGLEEIEGLTFERSVGVFGDIAYNITFEQPVDHSEPDGAKFEQRVHLFYENSEAPVILRTLGYNLNTVASEPLWLLPASNQLTVEHRYYGGSAPTDRPLEHLRIEQAAKDMHRVIDALQPLLPATWISTGHSKGGATAIYHRYFFPKDVDGTIAYVAPFNFEYGDDRYLDFQASIGSDECREKIDAIQIAMLDQREEVRELLEGASPAAYEARVISYAWWFWQYAGLEFCDGLPVEPFSASELQEQLENAQSFAPENLTATIQSMYRHQNIVERGRPFYRDEHLIDQLEFVTGDPIDRLSSVHTQIVEEQYDPTLLQEIATWAEEEAEDLMLVYGEHDPWTGGGLLLERDASRRVDSFVAPGENHSALITDLAQEDIERITSWLGHLTLTVISDDDVARAREAFNLD